VIVDEAQNLSEVEILTLLIRLCYNGKIIITGDESQDDRKDKRSASGLRAICEKLDRIDKVGIVTMTIDDVQRHGIVRDIIEAFE
jgi:phosphate starvation-inducible PhoH-like protein